MKFIDINKNINNNLLPIYIVTGDDDFLIMQTVAIFKKNVVTNFQDLNYNYFDGENFNINSVLNACNGLPFASNKKLVVAKLESTLLKADLELLQKYFAHPNPSTVFVLIAQDKEVLKLPGHEIIDCSKLDQTTLLKLIASRANNFGKTVTRQAGILLSQKCDNNAMICVNEVEKLCFYTTQPTITHEDVESVVPDSFELNIFNLTNALAAKDANTTLKTLANMLAAKTPPSQIIAAIANNFRRMFLSLISSSHTNDQLATQLKVKPYAIVKAKQTAAKFSVKNLKRINEIIQEVDFKLKAGKMSAENCVYYLVFTILTV